MNDNTGIRGREKEIVKIRNFIDEKIENNEPGILYIAGAPGTGKTMSVQFVLSQLKKKIPVINLNCMKAQTSKVVLKSICNSVGLEKFALKTSSEQAMICKLEEKFSSNKTFIIVLDELDQLPKSKSTDLIRTMFSWPTKENSKLILIGIANTLNLTSRFQIVCKIMGDELHSITKILFRPYTTQEIKSILLWYIENDENYEDANLEPKVLDMISSKFAREKNGDIRGALNALKSAIDDTYSSNKQYIAMNYEKARQQQLELTTSSLFTPPSTPPASPCKEKSTNIASLANSIKKRQKKTQYHEDTIPIAHQIILCCIYRLYKSKKSSIDSRACKKLTASVLQQFEMKILAEDDYIQMLTYLETQGLIILKRSGSRERIFPKAGFESDFFDLIKEKDKIIPIVKRFCP